MVTSVLIEDVVGKQACFTLIGDEEKLIAMDYWDSGDDLLDHLKQYPHFEGVETWSDLNPWHWTFLITENVEKLMTLPVNKRMVADDPINSSLEILLAGLVLCMTEKAHLRPEWIKIQRLGKHECNFDYHGSIMLQISRTNPKPGLAVVVDNTTE